ncbi:LysR family transcriptional regulator [Acinetobacter sp. MD2(2019)]|uniref:LysR family transcriptional regulator n=1 Tax=Acinetobacter sp. MD2(2019) TaxID=2605273 RepID=UPI002D1F28DE|nr:LysR family transcriptional regulator [Acinetobacter sp. MD2(2019)]MEB3754988.1 LysR family transcriptional regulator [Acinetobacter sp. MD2(2019)]
MKIKAIGQITDFDLKLLRVFKTVAACGSFAAAESVLGITRSAISLHMSDLEKRLGVRLCQRGRSGFALTEEGREILRYSEILFTSLEDFRQSVNQVHQHLKGELNIGIINNLVTQPQMKITAALSALSDASREVQIHLSMSTPSEIERGILEGRLHVGALPMMQPLSGLDYFPLYDETCFLYCSQQHPLFNLNVSVTDLKNFDAVVPNYRMNNEAMRLQKSLKKSATATDREGIAFLILSGRFVGFLPDHYAKQWVDQGLMQAILPEQLLFQSQISVVTRKGRHPNLILELFLEKLMA